MSDNPLKVLAECVDIRNGRRFHAGDIFDPVPTVAQARRLFAAGVLPEGAVAVAEKAEADAEIARADSSKPDDQAGDDLSKFTVEQLKTLAAERGVDLGDATKKADIVAAIELSGEGGSVA